MSEMLQIPVFKEVMQQGNALLEAAIVSDVLLLRLTTFSGSQNQKSLFMGEIKNISENEKLKGNFDSLFQVLECIQDPKCRKLDLSDMSLALVSPYGKKIELAKIMFEKVVNKTDVVSVSIQEMINGYCLKDDLKSIEIKSNFEVLANEIMLLKKQIKRNQSFDSLKQEILEIVNQQIQRTDKNFKNFYQIYSSQINLLKQQIQAVVCKKNDLRDSLNPMEDQDELQIKNSQRIQGEHQINLEWNEKYLKLNKKVEELNQDVIQSEQKQYFKGEIERVEQFIAKKLNVVGERFLKVQEMILKLNDEQDKNNVDKLTQLRDLIFTTNNNLQNKIKIFSNGFNVRIEKFLDHDDRIKSLQFDVRKLGDLLNQKMGDQKPQKIQQQNLNPNKAKKAQKAQNLKLFKQNKWLSCFSFNGKTLKKINGGAKYYQFTFFEKITLEKQFSFSFTMIKSKQKKIVFGVIDYQNFRKNSFELKDNNYVYYSALNGSKKPSGVVQGDGIKVGETVKMRVDRKNKIVKWIVNGLVRASQIADMLVGKKQQLYPFVYMADIGDTLEYKHDTV